MNSKQQQQPKSKKIQSVFLFSAVATFALHFTKSVPFYFECVCLCGVCCAWFSLTKPFSRELYNDEKPKLYEYKMTKKWKNEKTTKQGKRRGMEDRNEDNVK